MQGKQQYSYHYTHGKESMLIKPSSYPVSTGGSSLEGKRPGREADHSPPSSAEAKNVWSYISTLPIRLHGMVFN
jgi:hypothetical protein